MAPTVINTLGSMGVIRTGTCVGTPRAPSVPIVLRPRPLGPTPLRAVSPPVWSFTDWTGSQGQLRFLRATLLEMPLFHSNSKPIPFHLGSSGHFSSGCFREDLTAIIGASVFPWSFFLPPIFLLIFSTVIYCLSQLKQFF